MVVKTVDDKHVELQERREAQRRLGQAIDAALQQASTGDASDAGCGGGGLCPLVGKGLARALGLRAKVHAVSTTEMAPTAARADYVGATRIFGQKVDRQAVAQTKLDAATASMAARLEQLEARATEGRAAAATAMKAGQKATALRELKRAKALEKQAASMQSALAAVEQQSDLLAATALQRELASALGATAKTLKKDKKLLSRAEDAVDTAQEMRDMHDDVASVMSSLGDGGDDVDDDELFSELVGMIAPDAPPLPTSASEAIEAAGDAAEIERRHTEYDNLEALRQKMPAAPASQAREKQQLLGTSA